MYKQFFRYVVVGVASVFIDFAVYFTLTRSTLLFHHHLIEAKAVSFFLSSIFNFTFNKKWTFDKRSSFNVKEVAKYYTVSLTALVINALLMLGFLRVFADLIAWLFSATVTAFINFFLSRMWVFSPTKNNVKPSSKHTVKSL